MLIYFVFWNFEEKWVEVFSLSLASDSQTLSSLAQGHLRNWHLPARALDNERMAFWLLLLWLTPDSHLLVLTTWCFLHPVLIVWMILGKFSHVLSFPF